MEDSESTALGALIVALEGLGVYPPIGEAFETGRRNAKMDLYEPRMQIADF